MPYKNKENRKRWEVDNIEKVKYWDWNKKYKGTEEQYIKYKNATHCECCGIAFSGLRHKRCQDHNHETNELRDVICAACNFIEGYSTDDRERLMAVYLYCQRRKTNE